MMPTSVNRLGRPADARLSSCISSADAEVRDDLRRFGLAIGRGEHRTERFLRLANAAGRIGAPP